MSISLVARLQLQRSSMSSHAKRLGRAPECDVQGRRSNNRNSQAPHVSQSWYVEHYSTTVRPGIGSRYDHAEAETEAAVEIDLALSSDADICQGGFNGGPYDGEPRLPTYLQVLCRVDGRQGGRPDHGMRSDEIE